MVSGCPGTALSESSRTRSGRRSRGRLGSTIFQIPSGVFKETVTGFLGTNDDEVALRVFVVEDGVEVDGATPPREAD